MGGCQIDCLGLWKVMAIISAGTALAITSHIGSGVIVRLWTGAWPVAIWLLHPQPRVVRQPEKNVFAPIPLRLLRQSCQLYCVRKH
jgi:hypothetical protein